MKAQNRWIAVAAFISFVSSCGSISTNGDDVIQAEYFRQNAICINAWTSLMDEWKKNGGGLKDSIQETRRQISNDNTSVLSVLIRKSWEKQRDFDLLVRIGEWPVSADKLRKTSDSFEEVIGNQVPDECKSIIWLDPLLWQEIESSSSTSSAGGTTADRREWLKFVEVPESLLWESPQAAHWTRYWLLRKTEKP
jgi:hypothetical protein